jgi:glyoxylase I family protein
MRLDHSLHIGLDTHDRNAGESFAPHRTGLDHVGLAATSRDELKQWHAHLSEKGVTCSDIKDVVLDPITGALFTFTDPDGVALEFVTIDPPSPA